MIALAAAVYDVRSRRIPSWLTLPGIAVGLTLWAAVATPREFVAVVAVAVLAFLVGFLFFATGILGGGDGKLLTCVAALQGPKAFGECVVWMLVAGVAVSVALLGWRRALIPLVRRFGSSLLDFVRFGVVSNPIEGEEPHRMPFAIVVLIAVVATLTAKHVGVTLLP